MKEHSGNGKSNNNDLDPTLDEHKAAGGHREPARAPGEADAIGQPGEQGEKLSPSDRGRGETAPGTPAPPVDIGQ